MFNIFFGNGLKILEIDCQGNIFDDVPIPFEFIFRILMLVISLIGILFVLIIFIRERLEFIPEI